MIDARAIYKSKQPIQGFKEQGDRVHELQQQLADSKKELAESYEQSAKHARALFDYIENAKEAERRVLQARIEIDTAQNDKESLLNRVSILESSLERKSEALDTLSCEYKSLEGLFRGMEDKMKEQSKEMYQLREKASVDAQQRDHMESQIISSAKLINDLNEEIMRLREPQDKKRPRNLSMPVVQMEKDDSNELIKSSSSKMFEMSVLDSSACMGYYDKPPIAKHRVLVCYTGDIIIIL